MFAIKGTREYQEDCGAAIELGELVILAIADGFNKPGASGSEVSKAAIGTVLTCIGTKCERLEDNPRLFLLETFKQIHEKTMHFIAGSTLSVAIIDRRQSRVTLATVGDSIIALIDRNEELHIHPRPLLLDRHHGLASAFGDINNAYGRPLMPHIAEHELGPESVLIVSSDGLYPVVPENNIEKIEWLARRYIDLIRRGGSPQDLAKYASIEEQSSDNITVAVYKAEARA